MSKKATSLLIVLFVMGFWGTALGQSRDDALNLFEQGGKAFNQGRYEEALKYYEGALKISKGLKRPEGIAINLTQIGLVYYSLSRYEEALKCYEEALKINRELKIPQGIARNLSLIGRVYLDLHRFKEALKYFQDALKIGREQKIPQGIARNLMGIGAVYRVFGRYDEALNYFEEALKINRDLKVPEELARNLQGMGWVYSDLGRYDEALKFYEEALEIDKKRNNTWGICLNLKHIGGVYLALKDYRKAEESFKKAEKEWHNLIKGNITVQRRQFPQKQSQLRGKSRIESARFPGFIEIYLRTNRYKEALNLLNEKRPAWSASQVAQTWYHTQKGFALKGLGMQQDASEEFFEAVSLIEETRQKVVSETVSFFEARGRVKAYQGLVASLFERAIKGERKDSRFSPYGKDLASAAFYFSESTYKGRPKTVTV